MSSIGLTMTMNPNKERIAKGNTLTGIKYKVIFDNGREMEMVKFDKTRLVNCINLMPMAYVNADSETPTTPPVKTVEMSPMVKAIPYIGVAGGAFLAYSRKSSIWGYLGWMALGGLVGTLVAIPFGFVSLFKAASKDLQNSGTSTDTPDTKSVNGGSKMKPMKVDTIIKLRKQAMKEPFTSAEETDARNFLLSLSDSELSTITAHAKIKADKEWNDDLPQAKKNEIMSRYGTTFEKIVKELMAIMAKKSEEVMNKKGVYKLLND